MAQLRSIPTIFGIAFGAMVIWAKLLSDSSSKTSSNEVSLKKRMQLAAVIHPVSAYFVTQPWSQNVDYSNIDIAGTDIVPTGIALNLGETKKTQFLRALGFPIGAGGILVFPSEQGPKPPPNPKNQFGGTEVTLPNGKRFAPLYNLADPFEGRKYYVLDSGLLPAKLRGKAIKSKLGDEYSLAYFYNTRGELVDAFGRKYPPGKYDWSTSWLEQLGNNLSKGIDYAVESLGDVYSKLEHFRQVFGAFTNNPLWTNLQTGFAYIPGWGTAVSAGMAMAASYGRGESLADMGLAAARGAVPSAAQPAFDVAVAVARGSDLDDAAIKALRDNYIPAEYRDYYDKGIAEARKRV